MTSKKELWVFDLEGKRKYELTEELSTHILTLMKGLYAEWIINFIRDENSEWTDIAVIIVIDDELHNLKNMMPNEGISFMESLLRDIKIENIIQQ